MPARDQRGRARGRPRGRPRGRSRGRGRGRGQIDEIGGHVPVQELAERTEQLGEIDAQAGAAVEVDVSPHRAGSVAQTQSGSSISRRTIASRRSPIPSDRGTTTNRARGGAPSCSDTNRTESRKRRLELVAAEERAKIRRIAIQAQEQIELEMIDKRLQLQLAEMDESERGSSGPPSQHGDTSHYPQTRYTRTEEWVDASAREQRQERREEEREDVQPNEASATSGVDRLASAITQAIETAQERAGNNTATQRLVTRLSASRELPTFDGDPLEWPRFKRAFEASSRMCEYTEDENVARLFRCLKGDARDAVASLMIAPAELSQIIDTLQLRFGNPEAVARKIGREIKRLPKLDTGRGNLVTFATTVKNCVTAMEAIGHLGYLHSPELHAEIVDKIPDSMIHGYNRYYHERNEPHTPRLVILADFLRFEADIACKAGTADATFRGGRRELDKRERAKSSRRPRSEERPRAGHQQRAIVLNTREKNGQRTNSSRSRTPTRRVSETKCGYCKRNGHTTPECTGLSELPMRLRWRWASEAKVCFRCLGADHRQDKCRADKCQHPGCTGSHHKLLHTNKRPRSPKPSTETNTPAGAGIAKTSAQGQQINNAWEENRGRILLKVVPVKLEGSKGCINTYALLDEGSTVTLLDDEIADEIGAVGEVEALNLHGVSQMQSRVPESRRVKFCIGGVKAGSQTFAISGARTVPDLKMNHQTLRSDDLNRYQHLNDLDLPIYEKAVPKVLIGQDYWDLLTPVEIRSLSRYAPVASRTKLGWVVHGYATAASRQNRRQNVLTIAEKSDYAFAGEDYDADADRRADRELHNLVKTWFSLDSMGITVGSRKNAQDERAQEIMSRTAKRLDDRWEIGLLWKRDNVQLPDSYPNALRRLQTLEKKMGRDASFGEAYEREVRNLISSGYATKVTHAPSGDRTWYLPHFGVTHPNKPGKLRMVFDAAAKTQGVSLNDQLLCGPDLLNSLLGVLMRFRQKPVAFTADIKEMFLQIRVCKADRDSQLFLWRDGDARKEPDVYQMTSVIFGATSSPASALFVKDLNARSWEEKFPKATEAIVRKHYMDDYLDSVDTTAEARQLIADVAYVHEQGGFDIRGWTSNEAEALRDVPEDKRARKAVDLSLNREVESRTLGLIWKPRHDTLSFAINLKRIPPAILAGSRRPTKREMLRIIMSIFDPQGLLTPFTVGSKVMLQNVWRSGTGWDDHLANSEFEEWKKWLGRLREIPRCVIPRCYSTQSTKPSRTELHIFCNASKQAFTAVGYWRMTYGEEEHHVSFVAAKSRVAPLRPALSIPRMEMQAAVLGSRLATTIESEHDFEISRRIFWSDARAVLCWIRSDSRRHSAWLANRLGEIDERTNLSEWRWVPSEENPADDATRSDTRVPTTESRWFRGPQFLSRPEARWPNTTHNTDEYDTSEDIPREIVSHVTINVSDALPDVKRFSSWERLIRATAYALLFIEVYLMKARAEITVHHLRRAETLWMRRAQQESFGAELRALSADQPVAKSSRLIQLTPTMDQNGLMRVGGRIPLIQGVDDETRFPPILDGKHPYTRLLVMHYHRRAGHGSTETVVNELRHRYWIVQARSTVRSVTSSCQWCRIQRAKPRPPLMGNLPSARLAHHQRPFTYSGVDYFGPMTVTIGRRHEKRWGVLFTCLTTRAVHLEIAASLTTDSMIMALCRFAARRGYPNELWSDNGTNMRGAATELRKEREKMDIEQLKTEALKNRMVWRFIPPSAPHMGGCWERLIRSVKVALQISLKGQAPREEVLSTTLAEAEHSVNSRPLVHVSSDPRDPEALTPNHFLIGASSGVTMPLTSRGIDSCTRKQWHVAQSLADMFWARWLKEYLPTLQSRKKWNTDEPSIQEGDVVFMMEPNTPRNVWNRGVVVRVFPGEDGRTRVAEVRSGNRNYVRAVAKLITLVPAKDGVPATPAGRMLPT